MDSFFNYLSTHPIAAIVVAVIILFMVYFVIKKLLKLALICGLILIAASGYFYYKAPEKFPDNVKSAVSEVKNQTGKVTEKGKSVVEVGKRVLKKGKDLAVDVEKSMREKEEKIEGK